MLDHSDLVLSPELLSQESEVYRRQRILFVLIDILFTFNLVVLIAFLHLYNVNPSIGETLQFYYPLIWILISIIYDVCGLLVAYLCYQICLRMFAWIGIIFLVLNCFVLGIILFLPLHTRTIISNHTGFYSPRYVIFVIFWISISVVSFISVRLAFKLAKLISNIRHEATEPMAVEGTSDGKYLADKRSAESVIGFPIKARF